MRARKLSFYARAAGRTLQSGLWDTDNVSNKDFDLTPIIFIGFVALMVALVTAAITHYMGRRVGQFTLLGLLAWCTYAGFLGYFGILKNTSIRPPGIAFLVVPVLAFLVFFIAKVSTDKRVTAVFPLWLLIGTQCFRIVVELFLHQLFNIGVVPKMLTFEGANVDIYIGASAPLIAWLATRGGFGLKVSLAWNFLGLLALANVVTCSILTAPGPFNVIHAEVPNLMMSSFPYLFIPAFFVPLAVVLHVLAIRAIGRPADSNI